MSVRKNIIKYLYANQLLKSLFFNPLAEYHQWRLLNFVKNAASSISANEKVIDIGAGELKYKDHFSHCNYISNDLCVGDDDWNYQGIDIVSSAYDIPIDSDSFNAILCIQVLEHLDTPDRAFKEFHRILKPGGHIYLSAPLLAGEHQQPHDYFRYTRYGYIKLGEKHGLQIVSIQPHGGSIIAVETLMWAAFWDIIPIRRQTFWRYFIYFMLYPIKLITGFLALLLDKLDKNKSMTINYDVIYKKPN